MKVKLYKKLIVKCPYLNPKIYQFMFSNLTSVPVQSKMTANLRHFLLSPILNIIKIRDKYHIYKLNSRKNTYNNYNAGVYVYLC